MKLPHLVYRVSSDADYADQFQADPESTIGRMGFKVSADELSSLLSVIRRGADQGQRGLSAPISGGWR